MQPSAASHVFQNDFGVCFFLAVLFLFLRKNYFRNPIYSSSNFNTSCVFFPMHLLTTNYFCSLFTHFKSFMLLFTWFLAFILFCCWCCRFFFSFCISFESKGWKEKKQQPQSMYRKYHLGENVYWKIMIFLLNFSTPL